jgi:hypothetical protein
VIRLLSERLELIFEAKSLLADKADPLFQILA